MVLWFHCTVKLSVHGMFFCWKPLIFVYFEYVCMICRISCHVCVLKHCADISRGVVLKAWECGSNLSTLSSHVARVTVRGTVVCGRRHTTHDDSRTVWCSLSEKWSKVRLHYITSAVCMICSVLIALSWFCCLCFMLLIQWLWQWSSAKASF